MEDDGDRRNSPPLPSTYVTLVQLQQRWLQEKQRKQKEEEEREEQERKQRMQKEQEDEEKRKRQEEEEHQRKQKQANLQKRPVQSTATFHRRDHRPPLKSSAQFRAVGVSDGESKRTDDLKQKKEGYNEGKNWKMKGKPRAEEDLSGGKEQLLPEEKENVVDKIHVVSTERDYSEKERVTRKCKKLRNNKRGKARVEEDVAIGRERLSLEKEVEPAENDVVPVVSTERRCEKEIVGKCEEGVSSSRWKRGNGNYRRGVKNKGNNKRVEEEDLINIGREEMLSKKEVEAENVAAVVSTEREGGGLEEGNGKNLVVNGSRVWQERVGGTVVDRPERVLGKFGGLSVRGGGYGRNAGNVNGAPRRYGRDYGRGNSRRLQRPRDSNLVWVRKEEGDTSDANVAEV
ncbi:vicilin-like seed storage protein At2g18540 [Rhododendron vialii]|uniref:vicilin-like seed storage protein At2g18540 n=1 Tax=Rhododendron vialii TaxID=182163 RepID=UPI00265E9591|nr:vicilin-like seed storage protein At2g18540 [Rhododendron vialii]XP_058219175.1 vicilin-like seed storage protein At2g18540 [Rhododendron vialii]